MRADLDHCSILLEALPLNELSDAFKLSVEDGKGRNAFDGFRQRLLNRQEFNNFRVRASALSIQQQAFLTALGFQCGQTALNR